MEYRGSLDTDDLYNVLSNDRRRYTIAFLCAYGEPLNKSRLSDVIATTDHNLDSLSEFTTSQRRYAHQGMDQTHLPHLKRHNIIEHDDYNRLVPTIEAQYIIPFIVDSEMEYVKELAQEARSQ